MEKAMATQSEQCEKGYHRLAYNVAWVRKDGKHGATVYCTECPRHFNVEQFEADSPAA